MKWKLKDILSPTHISGNYEMWGANLDDIEDDKQFSVKETYQLLDNMDVEIVENWLREKKLKKIKK